ncbi:hypothetical protein BH11ARM2_BH11ARM2_24820 [soil metagenome]
MAMTHERDEPVMAPATRGFRMRAVVAALLLCVPVVYAIANQGTSGIFSLMVAPVSALLTLVILNIFLRAVSPKLAFSQTDLIVVFIVVSIAGSVAGEYSSMLHGGSASLPFHAKWNGTAKDKLLPNIPDWLAVKDFDLVKDATGGGKSAAYTFSRIGTYLPVWIGFGGLLAAVCFAMLCINSLMRGAWCERERLTFPLIQLPVAMCEDGGRGGMWKSRHMWIAFAVMFSIDILNGLNYLYPNLPAIPVKDLFYIDRAFKDPPLSNMGDFRISIYPFMAAVGLFVPSDLLFSIVVFFLLRKATHVAFASQGIPQSTFSGTYIAPGPPYFDEQTWGAVLAMFLGAFWVSREYLKEVWRDIRRDFGAWFLRRGSTSPRPQDGGIRHSWAFAGLLVCTAVVVWYGHVGGLPPYFMIIYFGLFLVFSVVLTRIRAQLGPPTHEFAFFGPNSIMHRFLGTSWLTDAQVANESHMFTFINRLSRNHPMPYQLEAMKMGGTERLKQRPIFIAAIVATLIGFFLSQFFYQARVYRTGGIPWSDAIGYFDNTVRERKGPDIIGIVMTIFGFALVLILDLIRFKFPGFPLHPAGYVLSMNFGVDYYWFGLLIALLVKNFVQRYYGLAGYDKLRMVALGILIGEYAAETIWMSMALITNQSTYTISFNDRSLGMQ